MENQHSSTANCGNCGNHLQADDAFCSSCGQKVSQSKISLKSMIGEFFYSVFNADSTLWKTLRNIWIPGKLTKEYFSGKRKSYLHPARLFLFSWVLFFAIFTLNVNVSADGSEVENFKDRYKKFHLTQTTLNQWLEKRDSLVQQDVDSFFIDQLDEIILNTAITLDTNYRADNLNELRPKIFEERDSIVLELTAIGEIKLDMLDMVTLTDEEIFETYQIERFFDKVITKQLLKGFRDTSGVIEYLIKGTSWSVLFLIPIMAMVMYLFFLRRKHYMVEHLVFLLHLHSFIFVAILAIRGIEEITNFTFNLLDFKKIDLGFLYAIVAMFVIYYFFRGLKIYYQQSITKTIIKGTLFCIIYILVLGFSLIMAMILRFLLF